MSYGRATTFVGCLVEYIKGVDYHGQGSQVAKAKMSPVAGKKPRSGL